jgi:hypothetical protein
MTMAEVLTPEELALARNPHTRKELAAIGDETTAELAETNRKRSEKAAAERQAEWRRLGIALEMAAGRQEEANCVSLVGELIRLRDRTLREAD